tara:strand:- start:11604 stop:11825 length:222 start_codon:yes stop_codon:yes gene_type:complete
MRKSKGMTGGSIKQPDVLEDGSDIDPSQIVGLKKLINDGSNRFWAKRGMVDPSTERGYHYGQKSKSKGTENPG